MSDENIANANPNKGRNPAPAHQPALLPMPLDPFHMLQQSIDYWVDACQRSILFLDVLQQRSNAHLKQEKGTLPTVLHFDFELLLDGHHFVRPVNYQLFRILPPKGVVTDPTKRPFIVFDPRAGHGPGIGGMKQDSEVGSTLRSGHPCYFVGFLSTPVPGQTIEDVCEAEAAFVAKVIELHPKAEKPCLIGNCQAGWQIAMMGAIYPELVGVMILPGAPLSYWAGERGKNPMRYTGGMLGGSWAAALSSDLGNGRFDGASLIENFEKLNPANTHWKKAHSLYAKVDTEAQRFLEFERWWGNPILLNGEEIQFIVDELFIGNNLSNARISTSDGLRIDLRNIKSPILVFCSHADDITPPQQALGWITDIYRNDNEIIAAGQTIIYCLHKTIGHLGIFVSSDVATKEHDKFIQNIDLIETLPPGLYEAVFIEKTENTPHADRASGHHVLRFEARKLSDIHKLVGDNIEDDLRFATVKRYSDNIKGMYETFVSPWLSAVVTDQSADYLRSQHPIRIRYRMFSDRNPFLTGISQLAEVVKRDRKPVSTDNFFWRIQEMMSSQIVLALNCYRDVRDAMTESVFLEVYGSPLLQAAIGLRNSRPYAKDRAKRDVDREHGTQQRIHSLLSLSSVGGLPEAMVRALLYVVRGGNGFDEREFNVLRQLCNDSKTLPNMSQSEFKAMVRQQHAMLVLDQQQSMEAISKLLDSSPVGAEKEVLEALQTVIRSGGDMTVEEERRLGQLEKFFVSSHASFHRRATDIQVFGD